MSSEDSICNSCGKEGHWACVCRSSSQKNFKEGKQVDQSAAIWPTLATLQCVNKTTNGFCKIIIGNEDEFKDRIPSKDLLTKFDLLPVRSVQRNWLRWFGYVVRMDNDNWVKKWKKRSR